MLQKAKIPFLIKNDVIQERYSECFAGFLELFCKLDVFYTWVEFS